MRAIAVVLGDVGRSPRMQYHAIAFAMLGWDCDLIGRSGKLCPSFLEHHPHINIHRLADPICLAPLWNAVLLLIKLLSVPLPDVLIAQTPPALPTFFVLFLYRCLTMFRVHIIIDWHNTSSSVLSYAKFHPTLVQMHCMYEYAAAKLFKHHICVTHMLRTHLQLSCNIEPRVLQDESFDFFTPLQVSEKKAFFDCVSQHVDQPWSEAPWYSNDENGACVEAANKPTLLISATSWTAEEDFDMLLETLRDIDDPTRRYLVFITGDGPLKKYYSKKIDAFNKMPTRCVKVYTAYFPADIYPVAVASMDVGLCMHKSTSGLDFPMKILDMLGCSLPVLAYSFNALFERAEHIENGNIQPFQDKAELKRLIRAAHNFEFTASSCYWFEDWKAVVLKHAPRGAT